MRRRELLSLIGGAALLPLAAKAQGATRRVGVLTGNVEADRSAQARVRAFEESLHARREGESDDLVFEIRWPGPDISLQQRYAEELVSLSPDVILATSTATTRALRKATTTIPIVFVGLSDPMASGIVSDLARPEANVTGFMLYEHTMAGKWVNLLKEMMPPLERVGVFFNPETAPYASHYLRTAWELGEKLHVAVVAISVRRPDEIEPAMARFAGSGRAGLIVLPDGGFIAGNQKTVIESAARHKLPAIYGARFYVMNGGLMSYGADLTGQFRDGAEYVDRILRGTVPADLPIQFSTRFDLVINAAAAEALGLVVPPHLLLDAELID
jgi:putative tryptophan/tyrosine transport system substrate-binding protein